MAYPIVRATYQIHLHLNTYKSMNVTLEDPVLKWKLKLAYAFNIHIIVNC